MAFSAVPSACRTVTRARTASCSAWVCAGLEGACGSAAQAGQQLGSGAAAGVAVAGTERGHPLLAEASRRGRGGIADQERQRDRRGDVGKDDAGTGPVRFQQRGQLVSRGHPRTGQVAAGAGHRAKCRGLAGVGCRDAQLVLAQPQVLGDQGRVAGVGFGARHYLTVPPGLDRVRAHRHDRVPGLQQHIDQPPVRPLDRDGDTSRVTQSGQGGDQPGQPVRGMCDRERGDLLASRVQHTHGVDLGGPVDPDKKQRFRQRKRHVVSSWRQRRPGEEADYRAVTNWRSAARPPVAGSQPRKSQGRQCHSGRFPATALGRHPGPRRVPTRALSQCPW